MRKLLIFLILSLFVLPGLVSAVNVCRTYDDFSSGLNSSKWIETTFHGDPFTDEHYVNVNEGAYHIQQNNIGNAETNLRANRDFNDGESFSYDLIYNGGTGNHQSQPLINGNYPPTQLETCLFTTAGCGPVGYWNDYPDLGAQIGVYKIRFDFTSDQVKMTSIRPDNITIVNTFTGNSAPFTLDINTHTGHNGIMHFDFDNFVLCKDEVILDSDNDGVIDSDDLCSNTLIGTSVDNNGCNIDQFCSSFNPITPKTQNICNNADWKDDESKKPKDCKVLKKGKILTCVANLRAF